MYTVIGATGNTGSRIAEGLLKAGKEVKAVSRQAAHLSDLKAKGAKEAVGDLENKSFVIEAFKDAEAVYAVIPPKMDAEDFRGYQSRVAEHFAAAAKANGTKYLVLLSSFGAHLPKDAGVVTGLNIAENLLKEVAGLNVLSLRAGFFFENLYASIGLIKGQGIYGGFPIDGHVKIPMVHTKDIASVAIEALLQLDFDGFETKEIAGPEDLSNDEVAKRIGKAIGKEDLTFVRFPYEGAREGMVQMGMSPSLADNYIEFCKAVNDGKLYEGYKRSADNTTQTTIDEFLKNEYAPAYNG